MMQSSRRKRERAENDRQDTAAGPTSSRVLVHGARGAPPQKRINISHEEKNEDAAVTAEVSPSNDEISTSNPLAQAQPSPEVSQSAATTAKGANSGNDHIEEKRDQSNAMNASIKQEKALSIVADGDTAQSKSHEGDNNSSLGVDDGEGTYEERIKALISHRKLLLERMRQCKDAAERRIKDNHKKRKRPAPHSETKEDKIKLPNDATKIGSALLETADGTATSDNDEVESYRETCRLAIQASKKERAEANEAEKRVSVSLRRGSSVGKRMNAALSSLVSGGGGSSSLPQSVVSAPMHQIPSASGVSAESLPTVPAASVQSIHIPVSNLQQAALNSRIQPVTSSSGAQAPTVQKCGGQVPKKRSSVGQKTLKAYRGAGQASSSLSQSSSALPLHVSAGTSGLPFNRLVYPTVHFPEAQSLRERRDTIREKLTTLIHERIARMEEIKGSQKTFASRMPDERLASPSTALEHRVNSPSKLPRRRKTHWDYLLEEMRWLATDFVEERKWKAASARTLSSAVVSNRLNAVAPLVSATERDKKANNDESIIEEENHSDEQAEKMRVVFGAVSETNAVLADEMDERTYEHPSSSDLKLVQLKGKIISGMIAEVWEGTLDCGPLSKTDEPLMAALSRHKKLRNAFENRIECGNSRVATLDGTKVDNLNGAVSSSTPQAIQGVIVTPVEPSEDKQDTDEEKARPKSLSNEEISNRIESSTGRIKERKVRRNRSKSSNESLPLRIAQCKASDFVEFVWSGDDSVGSVLDGPVASGKTVLSCSLMWRHHLEGAQLLVCSPTRLIKWMYELGRFSDLKVHVFGLQCGISSIISSEKTLSQFRPGDVVICEFSFLTEAKLDLSVFHTIVVDARFPAESLPETTQVEDSNLSRKLGGQSIARGEGRRLIPSELVSHQWWATILGSLRQSSARRLLIDNHETGFLHEKFGLDYAGLTDRERLDTLAAMSAFVVGPDLFYDENTRSSQHKAVSWAKHCAKDGSQRKRPRFEDICGVLSDAAQPFRHTIDFKDANEGAGDRSDNEHWEVRRCPLSASQRLAYEECCTGARGALSFISITDHSGCQHRPEPYQRAIQALLRLRRVCIHSQLDDVLGKAMMSATNLAGISSSVSQPHVELAADILSDSAKLRQLVMILRDECGFDIQIDADGLQTEKPGRNAGTRKKASFNKKPRKKKVAILAMLPEAQLLTSVLLNSIGISHELLASPRSLGDGELFRNSAVFGSPMEDNAERVMSFTMSWIDSQLSLLKFSLTPRSPVEAGENDLAANTFSKRFAACEVIITSPVTVGAVNGGLGIEAADVVICLDEDWSGRDALLFERTLKKCSGAHEMKAADSDKERDDHCSFIRLICEKTCEQMFLSGFDDEENNHATDKNEFYVRDWPSNGQGYLSLPSSLSWLDIPLVDEEHEVDEEDVQGAFRFPALNVLRYRGTILSTVLATSLDVPTDFLTGDNVRFLPFQEWEKGTAEEKKDLSVKLVRTLIAHENRVTQSSLTHGYPGQAQSLSSSDCPVPPFHSYLPSAVVTRHDMMAMASRIYIWRFGKRLASIEGSVAPAFTTASQLERPTGNGVIADEANSAVTADHDNLADAWHKSGLSCKPSDMVSSLLSYRPAQLAFSTNHDLSISDSNTMNIMDAENQTSVQDSQATSQHLIEVQAGSFSTPNGTAMASQRTNAFSASYCTSREVIFNIVKDGNQGCEPLAFFPPLFPSLLGASELALTDLSHLHTLNADQRLHVAHSIMDVGSKRKEPVDSTHVMIDGSKRPRLDSALSAIEGPRSFLLPQGLGPGLSGRESDVGPPGMSLTDVHFGGISDISKKRRLHPKEPSIVTEDEASQWDYASFLFEMGDDYGLLGIGALSSQIDSTRDASVISVGPVGYASWKDPYEAGGLDQELFTSTISCDAEEVEANSWGKTDDGFLGTMLLFVTKSARLPTPSGNMGMPASSAASIGGMSFSGKLTAWSNSKTPSLLPSAAIAAGYANGAKLDGMKKGKKKSQHTMPMGAFARVNPTDYASRSINPHLGQSASQSANGKETCKSKILSSILARQGGGRSTLFQVPSFLLASIRIRDDILRRVLSASEETIPVFQTPYSESRSWTSACYRLNASTKTGDSARLMSEGQLTTMQTTPSPVDFGPFVAGYISSPDAIGGALSSTIITGIALPMGVKISHRAGKQPVQPWEEPEDAELKENVLRYGLNWHLVARAVNSFGVEGVTPDSGRVSAITRKDSLVCSPLRSPAQCEERWRYLVRHKSGVAQELSRVERMRRKNAVTRPTLAVDSREAALRIVALPKSPGKESAGETLSLVLPSSLLSERNDEEEVTKDDTQVTKTPARRSFAALRRAAKKKREISMPIPGFVSGEVLSLVDAHPSHSQSVQAAVSTTSGGMAEMWPLQILADKQRFTRQPAGTSSSGNSRHSSGTIVPTAAQSQRSPEYQSSPARQLMRPPNYPQVPRASPSRSPQRVAAASSQQDFPLPASASPGVSSNGRPATGQSH